MPKTSCIEYHALKKNCWMTNIPCTNSHEAIKKTFWTLKSCSPDHFHIIHIVKTILPLHFQHKTFKSQTTKFTVFIKVVKVSSVANCIKLPWYQPIVNPQKSLIGTDLPVVATKLSSYLAKPLVWCYQLLFWKRLFISPQTTELGALFYVM